jgi:hypothetical protein
MWSVPDVNHVSGTDPGGRALGYGICRVNRQI